MSTNLAFSFWAINNANSNKPSIFELILMEQLDSAFYPAYEFLIQVSFSTSSRKRAYTTNVNDDRSQVLQRRLSIFRHVIKYRFESFGIIMLLLQRYFLRTYGSSMTEYLYGLKRVPISNKVKRPDVNVALFCIVAVPYIARKLDEYFIDEEVFLRSYEDSQDRDKKNRILRLKIYRLVRTFSLSACTIFKLLYSINKTEFFTPLLAYAGTKLRRISFADIRERQRLASATSLQSGGSWTSWIFQRLITGLQTSLMFSAVMFKFLEWYYAPSNASRRERMLRSQGQFVPPPPTMPVSGLTPLRQDIRMGACSLCRRPRRNPAATPSGIVYCYACIVPYVRQNGRDPISGIPCSESEIRRLI